MVRNFTVNVVRTAAAIVVGVIVGTAPVVWAQEATGDNKIDLSNLVFFKGNAYSVTYEAGVSTKATANTTVRKIGFGETTIVNITTTGSGVYSSDAMTNPHILYPGVHVERVPLGDAAGTADVADRAPRLAYWSDGRGWVAKPYVSAGSFAVVSRTPGSTVVVSSDGNCVLTATVAAC